MEEMDEILVGGSFISLRNIGRNGNSSPLHLITQPEIPTASQYLINPGSHPHPLFPNLQILKSPNSHPHLPSFYLFQSPISSPNPSPSPVSCLLSFPVSGLRVSGLLPFPVSRLRSSGLRVFPRLLSPCLPFPVFPRLPSFTELLPQTP